MHSYLCGCVPRNFPMAQVFCFLATNKKKKAMTGVAFLSRFSLYKLVSLEIKHSFMTSPETVAM